MFFNPTTFKLHQLFQSGDRRPLAGGKIAITSAPKAAQWAGEQGLQLSEILKNSIPDIHHPVLGRHANGRRSVEVSLITDLRGGMYLSRHTSVPPPPPFLPSLPAILPSIQKGAAPANDCISEVCEKGNVLHSNDDILVKEQALNYLDNSYAAGNHEALFEIARGSVSYPRACGVLYKLVAENDICFGRLKTILESSPEKMPQALLALRVLAGREDDSPPVAEGEITIKYIQSHIDEILKDLRSSPLSASKKRQIVQLLNSIADETLSTWAALGLKEASKELLFRYESRHEESTLEALGKAAETNTYALECIFSISDDNEGAEDEIKYLIADCQKVTDWVAQQVAEGIQGKYALYILSVSPESPYARSCLSKAVVTLGERAKQATNKEAVEALYYLKFHGSVEAFHQLQAAAKTNPHAADALQKLLEIASKA